jgi:hypothetical protein
LRSAGAGEFTELLCRSLKLGKAKTRNNVKTKEAFIRKVTPKSHGQNSIESKAIGSRERASAWDFHVTTGAEKVREKWDQVTRPSRIFAIYL